MKKTKFKTKIILLSVVPMLIMSVLLVVLSVINSEQLGNSNSTTFGEKIYELRRAELRQYTQLALSSIDHLYANASADDEQAQEKAKIILRNLRFGKDGYFFVYDNDGINLAHPIKPHLEGKNLWNLKDPNGVYLIRSLIRESKNFSGGYTKYVWDKPSVGRTTDKLSFTMGLGKWDWTVGTGLYLDDLNDSVDSINDEVTKNTIKITWITVGIALIVTLMVAITAIRFTVSQGNLADDRLQKLFRSAMEERDIERDKIADALNGEIAEGVKHVQAHLKGLAEDGLSIDANDKSDFFASENILDKTVHRLSKVVNGLRPDILVESGIYVASQALVDRLSERTDIKITITAVDRNNRPPINIETIIYRIVEEALSNIVKHSHAVSAGIRIRQSRNFVSITIQDNGVGFDPYEVIEQGSNKGLGLTDMQLQTEMLGGLFTLFSSKGTGTIIKVSIPLV